MKIEYILIIIFVLYILFFDKSDKNNEHYKTFSPYRLKDVQIKDYSYGYPFYCNPKMNNWINYIKDRSEDLKENFQQSAYKKCAPIATIILYTSSTCYYCKQIKPEWDRFVKNVKANCRYRNLIKVEHKKDDEIDDDTITRVPTIKLKVSEDKLNNIPEKTVEFEYDMLASMFERFCIENIMAHSAVEQEGNYYADCKKGKMYNKFYTLCDPEHQKWNTYPPYRNIFL